MAAARMPKVNALVVSMDARTDDATGRLDLIGIIGSLLLNREYLYEVALEVTHAQ